MSTQKNPYLTFRFIVEVNGIVVGGFSEVSGLQAEVDVETIEEGGVNDYVHKLPKKTKYPNLILKRGLTDSWALWQWFHNVGNAKMIRMSGAVILLDTEGNPCKRWNFRNAYPVKWSGPDLKADGSAVAIETLELAHEGLENG